MLLRVSSQPLEVDECVYKYLSRESSATYELSEESVQPPQVATRQSPSFSAKLPVNSEPSKHTATVQLQDDQSRGDPVVPPALGLPQDWIILPLPRQGFRHEKSIRIEVYPTEQEAVQPASTEDDLCGSIDIDWDDPDEPVKFAARPCKPSKEFSLQEALNQIPSSIGTNLDPLCFRIVSSDAGISDKIDLFDPKIVPLKRSPTLLTEEQLRDLRQASRHNIRVVTRNSLGLVATTALSGVAPQLLIAAAINSYCLTRGAKELHEHRLQLHEQGLKIRKRDISIAVAEGVAVKLALMIITINHDDFLVFANTFAAPLTDDVVGVHDALFRITPGLDAMSSAFELPAEKLQAMFGIATMEERAMGPAATGGWNENTKLLLQNIFLVGAVQAGMETAVEVVQKRLGWAGGVVKNKAHDVVRPLAKGRAGVKDDAVLVEGLTKGRRLPRRSSTL